MRKKEEIVVYPNLVLFCHFCDDYTKSIIFQMQLKKAISQFLFIDFIYLFITILLIIFKLNSNILSIILFFVFATICITLMASSLSKRKMKFCVLDMYPSFLRLLDQKKYVGLNSFTILGEMTYYIRNIRNRPESTLKGNHPTIWAIIIFLVSAAVSMILSSIGNQLNLYVYLSLLIVLIVLFCCLLIFKDLFDMIFSKDYEHLADSILLSCIEERRLEIIKSGQKNIFTKIKYALRLGEYH